MTPGSELLPLARTLINQGRSVEASHCLQALLRMQPAHLEAHNLRETHRLPGNFSDAFGIEARISPDDDIFRFFANHPSCTNPIRDYLSDGWRTMVELIQALEPVKRSLSQCRSFLEFASGFGRFSRHLVKALPPGALHVSDIVPGSVDFLKTHLNIDGFYSTHQPEDLVAPRRYEIIFVLSLFSHLPDRTWSAWLKRLYDMLEPGGVLVITTHGEQAARNLGVQMPAEGYVFIPSSESSALDGEEYGSTFTSADYVHQAIAQHLPGAAVHAFPAHFWGGQDAFVIVKGGTSAEDDIEEERRLQTRANTLAQTPRFTQTLWSHCRHLRSDATLAQLHPRIHPGDQMLLHSLKHFREVNRPLSQYYNVALQQHEAAQQILRFMFPKPPKDLHILDFACGYGRLLRLLTLSKPPAHIWAADIQADAVAFVTSEFGVHGLKSDTDPSSFAPEQRFHFIWVASLFSHLPEKPFRAWLARLHSLLTPDGVLCFSVHDACLLPPDRKLPAEGIYFTPSSEIADLDTHSYGTTYVSEDFVASVIRESLNQPAQVYLRLPRGLANEQDLYVVPAAPDAPLSALSSFRRGPWGWVDELEVINGQLRMHGWAASLDDGPLDGVTISINGTPYRCPTGEHRPDVAQVLGDQRLELSGWRFAQNLPIETVGTEVFIEVSGVSRNNEAALIYAGNIAVSKTSLH